MKKVNNRYSTKQEKARQLGMDPGTANNQLNKKLIFSLTQKTGEDICFKCGKKIMSADELSKEHKKDWMHSEDPAGLYFDIENIAYSHKKCNKPRPQQKITKNPTGYKGVSFEEKRSRFRVFFCIDNKRIELGRFKNAEEAAIAWDKKSVEVYGNNAVTNFPIENYLPESITAQ